MSTLPKDPPQSAESVPSVAGVEGNPSERRLTELKHFRDEFSRFMLNYQFGLDEILTKINILKTEFEHLHHHSPIEHVTSRLKTPESILAKVQRRNLPLAFPEIRASIHDIAGVRIVCSFIKDAYAIADMLTQQHDITVLEVKDYIKYPKPNGYKSLHLIVQVPVFLSTSTESVQVELQIRTIAMDFWASLEHKIYYKFDNDIPEALHAELVEAAAVASQLDLKMERIHNEVRSLPGSASPQTGEGITLDRLDQLLRGQREQHAK